MRDRYVLGRELGRGGMATVYAAQDVRHNRQVAVKVLHQSPRLLVGFGPPGHEWHRYGFRSWRGRFYLTMGDLEGNLWRTTVEPAR